MRLPKTWNVLLLAGLFSACASHPPTYTESAQSLADRIVDRLEARRDLRSIRLYIDDFQPCHRLESELVAMNPSMALRHEISARRLKHEIMGVLAPKLTVLESDADGPEPASAATDATFAHATAMGASAILRGNFAMDGDDFVVMLRVVDVQDRTVLAAAEGVVPHARAPLVGRRRR